MAPNDLALEVLVGLDADFVVGGHSHFEGEVGDREADRLGALQRVGGRGDADIDAARDQRRNALRERRFDDFGRHAEGLGEIVAGIDVEADRVVAVVTRAHRREVEHDGAAQRTRGDDVVELVGVSLAGQSGCGQEAEREDRKFHLNLSP